MSGLTEYAGILPRDRSSGLPSATRSLQSIAAHPPPLSLSLYLEPSRQEALRERRRMEVGTGKGHTVPKGLIL